MADPPGPTVAEGPEDMAHLPSNGGQPTASGDATPGEGAPEAGAGPADDTGTVAPADDPGPEVRSEETVLVPASDEAPAPVPETEADAASPSWPAKAPDEPDTVVEKEATATGAGPTEDAAGPSGGDDGDDGGDDDDVDDDDDAAAAKAGLLDKKIQIDAKALLLVLAVVGFLALATGAYLLGKRQADDGSAAGQPPTTGTTVFRQPTEYVPFVDEETGVKLSIPKEWTRRSTKNLGPVARLLAEVPNTQDTLLVRVNSYSKEVTKENLGDQRAVIDALFAEEKQLTILGVEAGELKGMPVLVYVYRFPDPSGAMGIHAHYFVFQGRKAVQLVFQALPETHYTSGGLGLVWGKISESLEVTPGPPPAFLEQLGGGATTVPGATTAPGGTPPPASAPPTTG